MPESDKLLTRIRHNNCSYQPEDAFLVPAWFPEQRSWMSEQNQTHSAIYNYPIPLRILGSLDTGALQSSLQEIRNRHQVLRSVFQIVDDNLVQIVTPPEMLTVPLLTLTSFDQVTRESEARRIALADALQPFDLERGPLLRASLLRMAAEDHILLVNTHHMVWDDWSTGLFLRELSLLYGAFARNQSSPLTKLFFQYSDFARWQNERSAGMELSKKLAFWRETLRGGGDFHHLAGDYFRPARRSYNGSCVAVTLDDEFVSSLKLLSQRERVSFFMTLLAGFQCLLHRYSGDSDIAVGSCAANRPLVEVEGLIGRFGNDLILRTDLSGNPTFRELLSRVRKTALTAYSYQDIPFGRLVEELQPSRHPDRHPLFQVMFILEDAPKEQLQLPGLNLRPFSIDLDTAKYDLNVWLRINGGLEVSLEYNTDLFTSSTMEQILADYKLTLEEMVNEPEGRLRGPRGANKQKPNSIERSCEVQQSVPQKDAIQSRLVEIWEEALGKRPIGINEDFFVLGGDSLRAARVFAWIKQSFGRAIPIGTLFQASTIAKLSKVISEAAPPSRCLVVIQPGNTRPPLFCTHGQSGNLMMYRKLADYLGPDQPVYGLQPQEPDGTPPRLIRIEDMAASYIEEIRAVQPSGPYFLAGHCMGGTIALEIAQQLRGAGESVGLLALLDTYNWQATNPTFLQDLYFNAQTCWFGWRHLLLLPPQEKRTFLQRTLHQLRSDSAGLPERNKRAALGYVPQVYAGRILHVRPLHQYARYKKPEFGWGDLAEEVDTFYLPIYPGQIFEEPFIRELAAKLRHSIYETTVKGTSSSHRSPEMMPRSAAL